MNKFALVSLAFGLAALPAAAQAQIMYGPNGQPYETGMGMMGAYDASSSQSDATSTDSDAAAGAAVWQQLQLQSKQVTCGDLTDHDFDVLGDYFMGSMMGPYHEQMDQYMAQSLGESGDAAMHIAMGKRLSGCDPNAAYPTGANGFPMMGGWGMLGGFGGPFGHDTGYGYSWGDVFSVVLGLFAVIGFIATIRWVMGRVRPG